MAPPIFADAGIPMIVLQMPAMLCAVVPVVLIEALLIRRWIPLSYKDAFRGVTVANLLSTIAGVPLAWLIMVLVELGVLFPVSVAADHWHWKMQSPVWQVLGFLVSVAWLGPVDKQLYWMAPAALTLLLVPSFLVSVWIERGICIQTWQGADAAAVRRGVFWANVASYSILFLLGCAWLAWELATKR